MPESFVFLDLASSESPPFSVVPREALDDGEPDHRFHCSDGFLSNLFDGDLHSKPVLSMANTTLSVIQATSSAERSSPTR